MEVLQEEPKKKKKLQILHDALIRDKYDVPVDYDVFERNLLDEKKSETLHHALVKDKYDVPVDYSAFARNLEVGSYAKKNETPGSVDASATAGVGADTGSITSPEPEILENGLTEQQDKEKSLADLAKVPAVSDIDWRKSLPKHLTDPFAIAAMAPERALKAEIPDNGINPVSSSAGTFNEMVVDAVASAPKTLGIISNQAERLWNAALGKERPPIEENLMYNAGQWVQDKAFEIGITATNPKYQDSFFLHDIPAAFGSVFSIIASQGRSMVGGKAAKLLEGISGAAPVKEAAKQLAKTLGSRPMVTGGLMMGVSEFDQAIASGASEETAFGVFLSNYELGMTEALPIQRALARINKASGGKMLQMLRNGTVGSIEEAAQEGIQTVLTNWVAAGTYDPDRAPFRDMLRSMGAGAFVGFLLPGIGMAMQKMSPEQRRKTQEILNEDFTAMKAESDAKVEPESIVKAPEGDLGTQGREGKVVATPKTETKGKDQGNKVLTPEEKPVTEAETSVITPETTPEILIQNDEKNPYADVKIPIDLAKVYHAEVNSPTAVSAKDAAIARAFDSVKINQESLLQTVGDKSSIGMSIAKSYLRVKGGVPIDQFAQNVSLLELEVTPDDVWDFMKRYPNGAVTIFQPSGNEALRKINEQYKTLTGKSLNRHIAKVLVEKDRKTREVAMKALSKPFEEIDHEDAKILADIHVEEKGSQFDEDMALRDELQVILDKGLTAESVQSTNIQRYMDSDAFTDEEKETINYIFEYGRSKEGLEEINSYFTEWNERIGETPKGFQAVPGFRENFESSKERREKQHQAEQERIKLVREFFGDPDYMGSPSPKKKVTVKSTEKKIAKLQDQIKTNPEHLKVEGKKVTAVSDHGQKMLTQLKNLTERKQRLEMKQIGGEQASKDKYFEPPLGMAKKKRVKGSRIQVSPIIGGKPKQIKDIMLDLAKSQPSTIYYTKRPAKGRRALGAYAPYAGTIGIKYRGDLDVTAHEVGHSLDDRFGILEAIPQSGNQSVIESELKQLSEFGSKPPKGHPDPQKYRMGEGMAEYIRAYLVNPIETEKKFPKTTEWIKKAVPVDALKTLVNFGTDIRTFAGLSAHQQVMSNVQFDPEKKKGTILEFFKPHAVNEDFKFTWVDKISRSMTNDKVYFEKAVKYLEHAQGVKLMPSQDPVMLARVFLGSNEKIDNIFEKGLVNSRNQRVVDDVTGKHMSFQWLFDPFENTNEASIKKEQEEALSYMVAERTAELAKRFGRENILTGIGAGIFKDTDVAKKRLAEFQSYPKEKQDRVLEAVRRYRVYADRVLKYMVEKGRLAQEQYDLIAKDNTQYVALQRILEAAPGQEVIVYHSPKGSSAIAGTKNIIHKIKGSSAQIKNPYESLAETTVKSIKESDRNEVMQAFRELFKYGRGMYEGAPVYTGAVARPAVSGDKNTVEIFVDGKGEFWQLDQDVYTSVKNMTDVSNVLPGWLTILPRLLRASVTTFPVFAVRNRIRDIQQKMVVSNTKAFAGYDIYKDKKTKELTKDLYQLFGAGQAGWYMMNDDFYYKKMREAVTELSQDKKTILSIPSKIAKAYTSFSSRMERATRLEEYRARFKQAKAKGLDDYNSSIFAAYETRDLLDFAVVGEHIRGFNQVVVFTNAAIQGVRKTIRSADADPQGFMVRFLLYQVLPAVLLRTLIHAWDKDEEYENMPAYRRDLFYNIPVGPDLWITVPKSFELGVLSSSAERFVSKHMFEQEDAFGGYHMSLLRSVIPVDDAMFAGPLKPFVEVMANYDFFRDKTIMPPDQVGLDLELRNTDKASRLGQSLQGVFQVDGRNVDHIIKSTTSYYGDLALRVSDLGKEETRHPFNWTMTGLLRNDPLYDSRNIQKVFDFVKRRGIHWSDPFYQDLNAMITAYYQEPDPEERAKIGKEAREFAKTLLEVYENDEYYSKRENQELEE